MLRPRPRAELLAEGPISTRPLAGARATISLQSLSAEGVVLLGRLTGQADGVLHFSDEAAENVRYGDEKAALLRRQIDDWIAAAGIDAPEPVPDPAEVVQPRLPDPPILSLDLLAAGIGAVVWCTGFRGEYNWADVPGLLDDAGQPVQEAGFAHVPGLYFPGLPFSVSRCSGTILAIESEALRIADNVARRTGAAA